MAQAICPGCREFSGSLKAVTSHMGGCSVYAQRFSEGADLPDPVDLAKAQAAERAPKPAPRAPRVSRPEVSEAPATVPPPAQPKRATRRQAGADAVARTPEPVYVEHWDVSQSF